MIFVKRRTLTPQQEADLENAIATTNRNAALIDYLAMMSDIDIPTEEDGDESEI